MGWGFGTEDDDTKVDASGNPPDVYMWAGTDPVVNGWAQDVSDIVKNDESYQAMSPIIKDAMQINGKTYAVPTTINFMGLWQNKNVLDQNNITPLTWGFKTEQWVEATLSATTANTIGIDNFDGLMWLPVVLGDSQWFIFDGEKYNYDDPVLLESIKIMTQLCEAKVIQTCNDNSPIKEGVWGFDSGVLGFNYEGFWQSTEILAKHDWEFIGLPGGNFTIIPDYMYVDTNSENPEWAVDFITFWADEGWQIKYDYAMQTNGTIPIPIVDNPDQYASFKAAYEDVNQPNIVKAYDEMMAGTNGVVEGFKTIPYFESAVRTSDTGIVKPDGEGTYTNGDILAEISVGNMSLNDYKEQLSTISNDAYQDAQIKLEALN